MVTERSREGPWRLVSAISVKSEDRLKFACGLIVGASLLAGVGLAESGLAVRVPTNGILVGHEVQMGSEVICRDPMVWSEFREGVSYIICGE